MAVKISITTRICTLNVRQLRGRLHTDMFGEVTFKILIVFQIHHIILQKKKTPYFSISETEKCGR
jgi:hypothetical protein